MQTAYRNILIGLLAGGAMLSAGSVMIPNSFTAGDTAKASEVNDNFNAVKTAVNGNVADISASANDIATNTHDIVTNKANIATNVNDIVANKTTIEDMASMWVRDHEGNIHPIVTIGSQVWMADNMYVSTYPDGTLINDSSTWTAATDNAFAYPIKKPSDYVGEDDTPIAVLGDIDIKRYGFLYQWNAAMAGSTAEGAQGICPTGWHIPTDIDWDQLQATLGDSNLLDHNWVNGRAAKIGDKLKLGGMSGFNGIFTGYLSSDGTNYSARGHNDYFWVSVEDSSNNAKARIRGVAYNQDGFVRSSNYKNRGYSVRCIKD
jgi:uncharacterized protein (TIGR02145 family)